MFYGNLVSFEYVALKLNSASRTIFINIYRSPKYCANFSEDLAGLLSVICMEFDCLLIVGDFNIHVDKPEDRSAKELCCVLENFGLSHHVNQPTNNKGHTLDLLISKGLDISNLSVSDVGLSDHSCLFFGSTISLHTTEKTKVIKKRYITENTSEKCIQAFSLSPLLPCISVNELVGNFNSKNTNIIDTIAPTKVKVISV